MDEKFLGLMSGYTQLVLSVEDMWAYAREFVRRVSLVDVDGRALADEYYTVWWDNLPTYPDCETDAFKRLYEDAGKPFYEDCTPDELPFSEYAPCGLNYQIYYEMVLTLQMDMAGVA